MKSSKTSFLRNCISGWNVREEIRNASVEIFCFPRRRDIKLRKKGIEAPKNFPVPPWRLPVSSIGNSDFLGSCADRMRSSRRQER